MQVQIVLAHQTNLILHKISGYNLCLCMKMEFTSINAGKEEVQQVLQEMQSGILLIPLLLLLTALPGCQFNGIIIIIQILQAQDCSTWFNMNMPMSISYNVVSDMYIYILTCIFREVAIAQAFL